MFKTYGPLKGYVWTFIIMTIWNIGFFIFNLVNGSVIGMIAMAMLGVVHYFIYLNNIRLDEKYCR